MKKMFVGIVLILFLSVMLSGCLEKYKIEGTGTIIFCDCEGGFYGILSDDFFYGTNKFDPYNLPSEFKEDGLRVKFKAIVLLRAGGFHMWGIHVIILKIERFEYI